MSNTLRVLHLVGSAVSDFYYQLSLLYAREVLQLPDVQPIYAVVHPNRQWQLGSSLDSLSEQQPLTALLSQLPDVDLVVPHMFCLPGMTSYRSLFEDILGLPLVGSRANCTALAANKSQTRDVVAAAGVRVAQAQQIRQGDPLRMEPPFIIKPNSEDNSLGVTLVNHPDESDTALRVAFEFDDVLLAEEFIPGRELRVAVIERDHRLYCPALIEYSVTSDNPIRTVNDKLQLRADGSPEKQPDKPIVAPVCPAVVTSELREQLEDMAKRAHQALGCRDYSLYDVRVHAETGEPYMLEAGLFWGFSRISMISRMVTADEEDLDALVMNLWLRAAQRNRLTYNSAFSQSSTPNLHLDEMALTGQSTLYTD